MATCEIVSIGTELLLGQITNTNSRFIAYELAELGIDCLWQTTVGDNPGRIKQCLRQALNRVDVLITTGGLGPTADDLTTECLADLFAVPLVFDKASMDRIESIFRARGVPMVESNRKQAMRPAGADILPNPLGTAPGIIWTVSPELTGRLGVAEPERPRYILTFPGVPAEMKAMWRATARPFLSATIEASAIASVELKHYGIGESALAEMYAGLLSGANPTVAPMAGSGECWLRVTAKAASLAEARALAAPVVAQIKQRSGALCYGQDGDTLESVVAKLLGDRGLTLAVAESCTGGLVSKLLTDSPGASAYTALNVCTYANDAKQSLLGVPQAILSSFGAVSLECARAMADGVRKLAGTDIGLSLTGIAGPDGGTEEKPVGLVYMALAAENALITRELRLPPQAGRAEIRARAAREALNMVRLFLLGQLPA